MFLTLSHRFYKGDIMDNNKRSELNTIVKVALLLGFAAFYLVTILSGSVSLYVHPRMIPFMIFAAVVMTVIAAVFFLKHLSPAAKSDGLRPLLLFIAALLIAWIFPAQTFNADTGTAGTPQLSSTAGVSDSAASNNDTAQTADVPDASDTGSSAGTPDQIQPEIIEETPQNSSLMFDADNYYENLYNIYADLDAFAGRDVELTGFIYMDEALNDNEFVIARLLMVCCAADMQTVGLLCQWPEAGKLVQDTWVTVTGTLAKTELDGAYVPVIEVTAVEETTAPDIAYIYPF